MVVVVSGAAVLVLVLASEVVVVSAAVDVSVVLVDSGVTVEVVTGSVVKELVDEVVSAIVVVVVVAVGIERFSLIFILLHFFRALAATLVAFVLLAPQGSNQGSICQLQKFPKEIKVPEESDDPFSSTPLDWSRG